MMAPKPQPSFDSSLSHFDSTLLSPGALVDGEFEIEREITKTQFSHVFKAVRIGKDFS